MLKVKVNHGIIGFSMVFLLQSTGEKGEMSCGWGVLKLFENNGTPISNRCDLFVVIFLISSHVRVLTSPRLLGATCNKRLTD